MKEQYAHVAQWSTHSAPCAVDHRGAPQEPGAKHGPGASAFQQRIISNKFYGHDKQGDDPG